MFIKPVADRLVPDPEQGGTLSPTGRQVEATNYWLRRLNDGDVVVVDAESVTSDQDVPDTTPTKPVAKQRS